MNKKLLKFIINEKLYNGTNLFKIGYKFYLLLDNKQITKLYNNNQFISVSHDWDVAYGKRKIFPGERGDYCGITILNEDYLKREYRSIK